MDLDSAASCEDECEKQGWREGRGLRGTRRHNPDADRSFANVSDVEFEVLPRRGDLKGDMLVQRVESQESQKGQIAAGEATDQTWKERYKERREEKIDKSRRQTR